MNPVSFTYPTNFDDEIKGRPMAQINDMKTALRHVGTGNASVGDSCSAHSLWPVVLLFKTYDIELDSQVMFIHRYYEVIIEDEVGKCYGGRRKEGDKRQKFRKR